MTSTLIVADIGGTKIALGHISHKQNTQFKNQTEFAEKLQTVATDLLRVQDPISALEKILQTYAQQHQLNPNAIVLGVPVSLAKDLNTVLSSPNIPQLEGTQLASTLEQKLGIPVRLERDINLLLLGEIHKKQTTSALGIFFGTGVGASFYLNGHIYRGASVGLEIGHIPIRGQGKICVCGNTDCLEAYACGHTLNALSQQHSIAVKELFLEHANQHLQQSLKEFVRDQAYAVATAINLFDPELCIIGGGIPEMNGFPRQQFMQTILEHLRRPLPRQSIKLEWAKLGSQAVLPGALAVLKEAGLLEA